MEAKTKLFRRDFTLVVIGQIISLFGNAILRFALPYYLLKETGSSTLFGLVTACSFLPMVVLSMVGGILADRINKRNIMVGLDFSTAIIITLFYFSLGKLPMVPLFIVFLMLLYGISGAYQPSVQASVPLLVSSDKLTVGNAVINQVNTLANFVGPAIGGIVLQFYGITPILIASIVCFTFSAIMEIFIHIPYQKRVRETGVFTVAKNDLKDSFRFLRHEKPIFISVIILVCIFNLVLSAVLIVGLPIMISEVLRMSDTLYGFSQSSLSLGGLCGGFLTAVVAEKLKLKNLYVLLLICSASVFLMGISLLLGLPEIISYWVITLMCFVAMGVSTLFVVQIYTVVQMQTPPELVGKIMATIVSVAMCGQPIGQMIYGILFDIFSENAWIVMLIASIASILITWYSRRVFNHLEY